MSNVFFTSDTHFGHRNVIKYNNRPFETVEEMDDAIIERWNSRVEPGDIVFHLGDFAMACSPMYLKDIMDRLNGKIILINGSHDHGELFESVRDRFTAIYERYVYRKHDPFIVLDHYAGFVWPYSHYGSWQLFGHSHGGLKKYWMGLGKQFDVGVDNYKFTPLSINDVERQMEELPKNFNFIPRERRKSKK